jgi:predicted transposase YdaD
VVKSEQEARQNPEWLVLSALMHGRSSAGEEIAQWLPGALLGLEDERTRMYLDLATSFLNEAARRTLEHVMRHYEYQSDFARKYVEKGRQVGHQEGKQEGKQEAEAAAVLTVLEARGFTLEAPVRERITSCKDLAQLQRWLRQAVVVQSVQELFAPEPGSPH